MKKRVYKRVQKSYKPFGIFLIIIGAVLLIGSFPGITGFTIFEEAGFDNRIGGVLGVLLVIVGISMVMAKRGEGEGGLERKTKLQALLLNIEKDLKSGKIGSYDRLRNFASIADYELRQNGPHDKVYHNGRPVIGKDGRHPVTIPRSKRIKKGTYRGILRSLYDYISAELAA